MPFASTGRAASSGITAAILALSSIVCGSSPARTPPPPAVAAPVEGPAQVGPELTIDRDLVYSRESGTALALDLYRPTPIPASSSTRSPVLIWIHGEGTLGGKAASPAVALIRPGGLAVASIGYRNAPGVTTAMQLNDVKAAIRWLRANAEQYNLDPGHIGVMGFGVGGQLAALAGTTGEPPSADHQPDPGVSSRVQAVVDLAGPVTSGGLDPATYVTADDAPFLILHGTADRIVSTRESQGLISTLKVGKVDSTLVLAMGVSHDVGDLLSPTGMQSVSQFFDQWLLGQRVPGGLSAFVATPPDNYIDPVALDLGGTRYELYPTPVRGQGTLASYRIYLPPGYTTGAKRRYPVIYFLHGMNVDSKRPITSGYISRADAAIRSGVMPPTIIVLAEGPNKGWYMDTEDGAGLVESVIIKDLIPYVDSHYRTIASPKARAIEGHSMGGYGALRLGFKYADMFTAVTGNSPAVFEKAARGIGSQAFWDAQSISSFARANVDKLKLQKIRIIAGDQDSLFPAARKVDQLLSDLGIPHEFTPVPGSPHNQDQLLQYETFDTMEFYGSVFSAYKMTK
jgi:acetyl esterase/lipase